jgi:hypothetical protein
MVECRMEQIGDEGRLHDLIRGGEGYIYNEFEGGAGGALYSRLHWAGCGTLARANLSYPKRFFSTYREAEAWLTPNRGPNGVGWLPCAICGAEPPSSSRSTRV